MKTIYTFLLVILFSNLYAQDFIQGSSTEGGISNMTVADFNNDGQLDIFGYKYAFSGLTKLRLFTNNDSTPISFTEVLVTSEDIASGAPHAFDYNNDGNMDVLFSKGDNLDIYVLQNDGAGNFTEMDLAISGASSFRTGDVDEDGDMDIIGADVENNIVNVYFNNGTSYTKSIVQDNLNNMEGFEVSDMDNDGDLDIIISFSHYEDKQIIVLKNTTGTLFITKVVADNTIDNIEDMNIGDINGDGLVDIFAVASSGAVWINNGNFSFTRTDIPTAISSERSISSADYDQDGKLDLIIGSNSNGMFWFKNTSTTEITFEKRDVSGVSPAFSFAHADFDQDGAIDIAATNGELWIFENNLEIIDGTYNLNLTSINAFPNPFNNYINFDVLENQWLINITDLHGKVLLSEYNANGIIETGHLNRGIYFMTVYNKEGQILSIEKMTKIN